MRVSQIIIAPFVAISAMIMCMVPASAAVSQADSTVSARAAVSQPVRVNRTPITLKDGQRVGTLIVKQYRRSVLFINSAAGETYGVPTRRALVIVDLTAHKVWTPVATKAYYFSVSKAIPAGHRLKVAGLTKVDGHSRWARGTLELRRVTR